MDAQQERLRIGQRIREEREKRGMSQNELSELIGIGANNLSRIELGKFNIGADTLHKIAEALDLRLDFMPSAPNPHQKPV